MLLGVDGHSWISNRPHHHDRARLEALSLKKMVGALVPEPALEEKPMNVARPRLGSDPLNEPLPDSSTPAGLVDDEIFDRREGNGSICGEGDKRDSDELTVLFSDRDWQALGSRRTT